MIKHLLIYISLPFVSLTSFSQSIQFTSNVYDGSYIVDYQSVYGRTPSYAKIDFMKSNKVLFYKEGYYTKSYQLEDKKGPVNYQVSLEKYENIYLDKITKKIQINEVVISAKSPLSDYVPTTYVGGGYGYQSPTVIYSGNFIEETINSSKPFFATTIFQTFKGDGINAYLDEGKEIDSMRYTLSADITHFWILWKKYNPAMVRVKWSVYDKTLSRTVYTTETEGASEDGDLKKLLMKCMVEASKNLIRDERIQKYLLGHSDELDLEFAVQEIPIKKISIKEGLTSSEIIKKGILSTVTVRTENGHGSGFIVSSDGYIITNKHVIEDAKNIEVIFSNGFILFAKMVRNNSMPDVALLKVDGKGFPPFVLSASETETGDELIVIGTPKDISLGQTVTRGIISGKREFQGSIYIQTDASINPGNSGGPILNLKGAVIGVATYKTFNAEGISFGIPIQDVIKALHLTIE